MNQPALSLRFIASTFGAILSGSVVGIISGYLAAALMDHLFR